MAKKTTKKEYNPYRPNLWGFLRDVLVALINVFTVSIDRGVFLIAVCGIISIIIVSKIPSADTSILAKDILTKLETGHILGWGLTIITTILWYFNSKRLKRVHKNEIDRVAKVKTELQNKIEGRELPSSEN